MHIAATFLATLLAIAPAQANDLAYAAQKLRAEMNTVGMVAFTSQAFKPGSIRHIVLFRYKDGTTIEHRKEIRRRLFALRNTCKRNGRPYIESIEGGAQMSGEGAAGGFQDAFIVTFQSEGDRNYYVGAPVVTDQRFVDPDHEKFKAFVGPFLAVKGGVLVFDFSKASSTPPTVRSW